jgi:hypothetical protein
VSKTLELVRREPSAADLEAQTIAALPAREALSLVNANLALPINAAIAANVLSDNAVAAAGAQQNTPINQGSFMSSPLAGQ